MTGWFWAGLATGLAANECVEISEWVARRMVRWSAHIRYEDEERAKIRAQELVAVIADRPCQLFKLITAACFVLSAVYVWVGRAAARAPVADVHVSGTVALRVTAAATTMVAAVVAMTLYAARPGPAIYQSPAAPSVS